MDFDVVSTDLGVRFAEVASRTSYDWVTNKLNTVKQTKKTEDKERIYDDIINNLMTDKAEMERVAAEYKRKYEQITISDSDILHLQETIKQVVILLNSLNDGNDVMSEQDMDVFLTLVSKDTLKTMQLLGFNYKEAIGEPFTKVVSNFITYNLDVAHFNNVNGEEEDSDEDEDEEEQES